MCVCVFCLQEYRTPRMQRKNILGLCKTSYGVFRGRPEGKGGIKVDWREMSMGK